MRKLKIALVCAVFAVAGALQPFGPAGAHHSNQSIGTWHYRSANLCVYGANQVNHSVHQLEVGSYQEYSLFGAYGVACGSKKRRAPGNMRMRAVFKRNGSTCASIGWVTNLHTTWKAVYTSHAKMCGGSGVVQMVGYHEVNHSEWYGGHINGPSHNYNTPFGSK